MVTVCKSPRDSEAPERHFSSHQPSQASGSGPVLGMGKLKIEDVEGSLRVWDLAFTQRPPPSFGIDHANSTPPQTLK